MKMTLILPLLLGGCASVQVQASPLILYDAPVGQAYMQALTSGVLSREGNCVYLVNSSGRSLLMLPSPTASWNASRGTILFAGRELRFGEEARFGGGEGTNLTGPQAEAARRAGCDAGKVWWASPESISVTREG